MRRIWILCERPPHLLDPEAQEWLRDGLAALAELTCVCDVRLVTLERAGGVAASWRWLAGIALKDATRADDILHRGPLAELVGDLRLVGMRPELVVVPDQGEPVGR